MSLSAELKESVEKAILSTGLANGVSDWEALPGDASNRSYVRLLLPEAKSRMLMILNAPEAFKSEEVTGGEREEFSKDLDFVRIAKAWSEFQIRLPRIDFVDPQNRFLISEDLGDELLYARRQGAPALEWYERALDELAKIQRLPAEFPYKKGAFTPELLAWEFEHFQEYALDKRNKTLSSEQRKVMRDFYSANVETLSSAEFCVVHRDYHSKNLMILRSEERVGVIDFQDALLGPRVYDLASLLRDSYVSLAPEEEKRLFDYFNRVAPKPVDYEIYSRMSLQRNMKAVGRFFYISMVKGRDTHLPFVKPSLQRIFKTLEELNEQRVSEVLHSLMSGDY